MCRSTLVLLCLMVACAPKDAPPAGEEAAASPAAAPSGVDPCSILTAEEVQTVMGWAVAKSEPRTSGAYYHCTWSSAAGGDAAPPETVEAGITPCFTNFPCRSETPAQFATSAEAAEYRRGLYKGTSYEAMEPKAEPVEGLGSPAIVHELGGQYSLEVFLGAQRTAYVSLWTTADAARSLGEKMLGRVK